MPRCLIALGGNTLTSDELFHRALNSLQNDQIRIREISRIFATKPVGPLAGETFLNAAATVDCECSPQELLNALHRVESEFGRARTVRWGPRILDLDLCLFGDAVIDLPSLVVPHPLMWFRGFVLVPAADIAGEMRHPILQERIQDLHLRLTERPGRLCVECSGTDLTAVQVTQMIDTQITGAAAWEWIVSEDTASPLSDANSLNTRISSPANSPPLNSPSRPFATIRLMIESADGAGQSPCRTQPSHEAGRRISLTGCDPESLAQQLQLVMDAIDSCGSP